MEDSPLLAESVRRPRFSLSSSMRLTVTLLGLLLISRWAPSGAVSLLQHHSQVALLEEELTDEAQSVELLRFITPYKTEVEAIVDVTGYAQLLKDVLAAEKELRFYVGIDTWVGNDTRYQVLYFNNVTGRCQAVWSSQGNAWNVSLDLIAWPRTSSVPIQPRDTILLAESFPNPLLQIGQFQVFEASLRSSELALPEPRSLFDAHEISSAVVYPCEGVEQFQRGASLGFLAQQAEDMVLRRPMINAEVLRNISVDLEKLFLSTMVSSKMITAKILNPGNEPGSYLDVSLSSAGNLSEGLPVFFASGAVVTDARYTAYLWMNMSMAFEPIGFVKKVLNATHFRMNVTLAQCFHHLNSSSLPQLQVPKDDRVLPEALSRLRTAAGQGIDSGLALRKEQKTPKQELRVLNAAGTEVSPIATVRAQSGSNSSDASRSGQKVCVVKQNRQGHVFTRSFTATLSQGERGVLHFTATGHGWAATSEQCGEYCHAVYHLRLNGKEVANVTQWRDDCYLNPTGPAQHGTWYESRNGWCPGSVEPGIYLDVSEFLASGENVLELGLTVWLNATHRYDKYTDVAGFIQQDVAMLAVSTNLLLYAAPAVSAALAAPRASSKAQLALRQGCSDPKALRPPAKVQDLGNDWLTSPEARKEQKEEKIPRILPGQVPFDFEARAPWYFYNHSEEILPGVPVGASYLNILNGTLVQSNSRTVYGMLHELKPAQQLALRLRLLKPAHLEMDHWDRVASVGLMVPKALDHVQIQTAPSREPAPSKYWRV